MDRLLLLPFLTHYQDNRLLVYTDGACANQSDPTIRIAGYGVFYYEGSAWNTAKPLYTYTQTSDRAELRALVWAVQWASEPIHVKLDNEYVSDAAVALVYQSENGLAPLLPTTHNELWAQLCHHVLRLDPRQVRFRGPWDTHRRVA